MSTTSNVSTTKYIDFYDKELPFPEFSNFHETKSVLAYKDRETGEVFMCKSSEHAYQAKKFCYVGASEVTRAFARVIATAKTPYMSKILAGQKPTHRGPWCKPLNDLIAKSKEDGVTIDPRWEAIKDEMMFWALQIKYENDTKCRESLLSTGDAILSEFTTRDSYWGNGGKDRKGKNVLGNLLMRLRQELRNKSTTSEITTTTNKQNDGKITNFLKRKINDDDIVKEEEEHNVDDDEIEIVNINNNSKKSKLETKE